ncbi:MAG: hypothetical protein ACD_61C00045G0003 [uncultured bacterium]|nr:MAG: hypothetical protein ACD_61C00045G0003 [uncultured bacterium]
MTKRRRRLFTAIIFLGSVVLVLTTFASLFIR